MVGLELMTATRDAGGFGLHGGETADELLWLGFAVAHVALYRERQRLERIERFHREALLAATGTRRLSLQN